MNPKHKPLDPRYQSAPLPLPPLNVPRPPLFPTVAPNPFDATDGSTPQTLNPPQQCPSCGTPPPWRRLPPSLDQPLRNGQLVAFRVGGLLRVAPAQGGVFFYLGPGGGADILILNDSVILTVYAMMFFVIYANHP